jgi:Zn-dependent peptidase ImmA (M78 family)
LAPLVFINGADSKAAQMFTLAHELAHIWAGESAVSDIDARVEPAHRIEQWCNRVAAELLVPLEVLQSQIQSGTVLMDEVSRLARQFKVSTLVILLRLFDSGRLSRTAFQHAYDAELERLRGRKSSGGDFYLTQAARAGKRFARALVADTLEGRTLYRDALQLLGISRIDTFHELGRSLKFRV